MVLAAFVAVALSTCGGDDVAVPAGPGAPTTPAASATEDVEPTGDTRATPTASASPTDGASSPDDRSPDDAATPSGDVTALPGEPYDDLYIDEGDVLGVIGVAHDDVLNVRELPTIGASVLTTLEPTAYGLVSTGRSRAVDGRFWHEVTIDGVTGWVSWRHVAFVGPTFDDTSRFVAARGYVRAETMVALGRDVATFYEPADPEGTTRVVMSVAPSVGDLGEVTHDVVGIQDDAGAGYRLHVLAQPDESGEGFTLRTVEVTDLCYRGGTPETECP